MADGIVAANEKSVPRNVMRGYLNDTDRLVAWKMHDMMRLMYADMVTLSANWASVSTKKSGYADEFKSSHYDAFMKNWEKYRNAYETARNNPNSETALKRHSASMKELINGLSMAMPDYASKRTDLWFRYIDEFAKPLDAAFWASLIISPFTEETSLVPGFIAKGFSLAAKKLTRKVLGELVEKSVAKSMFRKELLGALSKTLAYPAAASIFVMMGKDVSSGAFVEPAITREAAEKSSFLNAIVNLPPDAKERKDIEDALGKIGAMPEVYLPVVAGTMKEMGDINPISHLNWTMMALYAVWALPYLPAKAKKPIKEAIAKAMKRKRLLPSTVAAPASGFP
jgi:hypothetical protein